MDWDDLKVFLALARAGSMRAASEQAERSHATVSRRVGRFEARLGVRLFERTPRGLQLTVAGEDLLATAESVELELLAAEQRLAGHDRKLAGRIRVTMVDVLASELLMADLVKFCELYPAIELELVASSAVADLARHEADIALRFTDSPPDYLIGHKLASVASAAYASQAYIDRHDLQDPKAANWIGIGHAERFPAWVRNSGLPHLPARGAMADISLQLAATRHGLGIGFLPCFVGDSDARLVRVDAKSNYRTYSLWLLRHPDTRQTARLRVFSEFLAAAVLRKAAALAGV
ncbi:MAG: LysR family transcriptional regulator [Gammaproteobacteria bacterium]|nr:LysR family transcriptional regulator [Gammaproteobacteria bacterium]